MEKMHGGSNNPSNLLACPSSISHMNKYFDDAGCAAWGQFQGIFYNVVSVVLQIQNESYLC